MYEHHKANAIYKGEKVKILKSKGGWRDTKDGYHPETVEIEYSNWSTLWVEPSALEFPFNVRS